MNLLNYKNKKGGQAIITATVLFLFISVTTILGVSSPVYNELRTVRNLSDSKGSFFASESGQEDVVYRLKSGLEVSNTENLSLNNSSIEIIISDIEGGKNIKSVATTSSLVRKIETNLIIGEGFSFNYGVQVGDGGLYMRNFSSVLGNVFTSGPITTDNSPIIEGDAISAGPGGLIDSIDITGNAFANTIIDSDIGGDAYYQTISNTTVAGTEYPGSPDQEPVDLPISDSKIEEWKTQALDGGTSSECEISQDTTIGPIKFECSLLTITGDPVVTLEGPVWVSGDIEVDNTAQIIVAASYGANSIPIIAHNESDESGSGTIILRNSVFFDGPNDNHVLMVSMNNDAETIGSGLEAILVQNSVEGDLLLYAPHGLIELQNNVDLKEVTAYQLELQNSAQVVYDTGLANLLFSTGPSGGYTIDKWQEVE